MRVYIALALAFSIAVYAANPPFASVSKRLGFLRHLDNVGGDEHVPQRIVPIDVRNKYWNEALMDENVEIRKWAAGASVISDSHLPPLIRLLAHDPSWEVRQEAALSISNWTTANGAETCTAKAEILRGLDDLLLGLKSIATAQQVVETLGGRYSGDTALSCCMPTRERKRIRTALVELLGTVPGGPGYGSWGDGIVTEAIQHIDECPVAKRPLTTRSSGR